MSVARVTEISASSKTSFDRAIQKGIKRANTTLKNVRGAWIESQKVSCDREGNIRSYRVIMRVTFVLED
jgi:flavin-binding protein dodecin